MFDLAVPLETQSAGVRGGGGYIGLFLRYPLQAVFGFWASWLILLGLAIASLMIIFDTSLEFWVSPIIRAVRRVGRFVADFWKGFFSPPRALTRFC